MTLFEINEAIRNFEYEYDPDTGEWTNEAEWNDLEIARDAKIEGIACLIKEARATSKAISEEMKNLKARAEREDRKADNLENWLAYELGGKSYVTPKASITFKRSETTDIIEEKMIPEKYMVTTTKTETKPDKMAIKKAIKAGEEVPGCQISEHYNIQVR